MMKKNIFLWLLFVLTISVFITRPVCGQSENDELLNKCASGLGTYNYIKSFKVNVGFWRKNGPEYSYVFSKGSTYMLIVCNENNDKTKMIVKLFDKEHNLVASNYNEKSDQYFTDLLFPCTATGVYYIKLSLEGVKRGHGICILGFNKDKQ